jgi:isoleucyl-tRNA synthetase
MAASEDVQGGHESEEVKGLRVKVTPNTDPKCHRCWVHDSSVGKDGEHPTICDRCVRSLAEATGPTP